MSTVILGDATGLLRTLGHLTSSSRSVLGHTELVMTTVAMVTRISKPGTRQPRT